MISATSNFVPYWVSYWHCPYESIHTKKDYIIFHSPQEGLSNQGKWQRHSPSLNLVLEEVEVLQTNTAHTILMLSVQVVVTTAHLQCFKLILQNKTTFGCMYIHSYSRLREEAKTIIVCELRSTGDSVNTTHYSKSNGVQNNFLKDEKNTVKQMKYTTKK